MRPAALAAAAVLLWLDCGPSSPAFRAEAELHDGRTLSGSIRARLIPLTLLVGEDERVGIELPPSSEVEWLAGRGVYRIRSAGFTAEALEIGPPLVIRASSGAPQSLSWRDIRRVRIYTHH